MLPQHHSVLQLADEFIEFFTEKIAKIQDEIDKNLTTDDRDHLFNQRFQNMSLLSLLFMICVRQSFL